MPNRTDSGPDGCRTGQKHCRKAAKQVRCRTRQKQDRSDAEQDGFRIGRMQDSTNAGQARRQYRIVANQDDAGHKEGCSTRLMQ